MTLWDCEVVIVEWTKQDTNNLRQWRDKIDSDNIKIKEYIKQRLIDNKDIVHVLANKKLEEDGCEPDEYFGVNILPFYLISLTQHNTQNFICYETSFDEIKRYSHGTSKLQQIIFYILCHKQNLVDKETGLARHDLLSALISDVFDWSYIPGGQIHLVSDKPSTVDNDYASRTLIFEQITDNTMVKTRQGNPTFINKVDIPN